ncbi:hypothetical protein JOF29_006069 [Kribbella aluminosa]|uniref:Uncharacterized protein n=1 Tax=Kribbella aluminosa TaxID=416017 RepID=A0ABS4UTI7_9ACTN|nr:hypothetical protein [Kribbella aluminosa]MBP2354959.1 hypothetical protein [Kribbella aluminosa]
MGHDCHPQRTGQPLTAPAATVPADGPRRVRVWLGEHAFINYPAADASKAAWFEGAMRNQFRSCRITNDPDPDPGPEPMPGPTPAVLAGSAT